MIILISPSKTMSKREAPEVELQLPQFLNDAEQLSGAVNELGTELAKTLGVSEKIAELNRERFAEWSKSGHNDAKPAMYAYASDVYNGLAAFDMTEEQTAFAESHLRILSGLYGSLRPFDRIMPYRLEMSTKLAGEWGKNLYQFWGSRIAEEILETNPGFVLNCASNEYAKAVLPHLPDDLEVVTPTFLHDSGSGPRAKMTFAKYTRGLMARWAIENELTSAEQVLSFDAEGYEYRADLSEPGKPTFLAPKDFSLLGRFIKF